MALARTRYFPFKKIYQCTVRSLTNKAFIDNKWVDASNGKSFPVLNPADCSQLACVPDMNIDDAEKAINAAHCAFQTWAFTSPKERSQKLRKWFDLLEKHKDEITDIIVAEAGKARSDAAGEVIYGNSFIEWFAEEARRINGEIINSTNNREILLLKQPIGVVALITPWNFPLAMLTRKAGAALAAGCTCVIKPSEDTPLTTLLAVKLSLEAGFPPGVINVVTCGKENTPEVGRHLCEHENVRGLSFTGSTQVGKLLYKQSSGTMKRLGLELGGNAPFIVFESADVESAVQGAFNAKSRNAGQTCISPNRFFLHEKVHDEFIDKIATRFKSIRLGPGKDPQTTMGPLINQSQANRVSTLVKDAITKGAQVICGGHDCPDIGSLFYAPTLLTNVTEEMTVFKEEIFGPIIACTKFSSEEEVLKIANHSSVGLAGYIYSQDMNQIWRVTKKLELGMVGVNESMISTAEAAFGGVKHSGLGREGSHHGIDDYVNIKYMCLGNLRIKWRSEHSEPGISLDELLTEPKS